MRQHTSPRMSYAHVPALMLVLGSLCVAVGACAPPSANSLHLPVPHPSPAATFAGPPAIHTLPDSAAPTPAALGYVVGLWPSESAPAPYTALTVYVSFHDGSRPVAGGQVTITLQYGGPAVVLDDGATNAAGYDSLNVESGVPNMPVQVYANVTYDGQSYQAMTSFTTLP